MNSPTSTAAATAPSVPRGMDPAYYSLSLLRRRKLEQCVAVSTDQLQAERGRSASTSADVDQQLWCIQTKALTLQSWYDDVEIEDDGVDDILMDGEQAVVRTAARPGTSLTGAPVAAAAAAKSRRGTGGGRPISSRYGYARPGTLSNNRPGTNVQRGPGGTAVRPITGRFARLGTASLLAVPGGPHIDLQRLNLGKYAREQPMIAKVITDYLLYVEHRPRMVLELCTAALKASSAGPAAPPAAGGLGLPPTLPPRAVPAVRQRLQVGIVNSNDWWWKARLAKANYQLGQLREAEQLFKAALFEQPVGVAGGPNPSNKFANYNTSCILELGKVYSKMDQPLTALELFTSALAHNPVDHHVLLATARLQDELHQPAEAYALYSQVLQLDSSNVEAIACIAAYHHYERNQPELSLRLYRRLLQMGVQSSELWNNLGLCAFYTSQFDFALSCMERALSLAEDDAQRADVWYNIGHIGISLGDCKFAEHALRLAVACDATHAEALNNLAVLALRGQTRSVDDEGSHLLRSAILVAPDLVEALYNVALQAYTAGELEEANNSLTRALDAFPDHPESVALQEKLRAQLLAL